MAPGLTIKRRFNMIRYCGIVYRIEAIIARGEAALLRELIEWMYWMLFKFHGFLGYIESLSNWILYKLSHTTNYDKSMHFSRHQSSGCAASVEFVSKNHLTSYIKLKKISILKTSFF